MKKIYTIAFVPVAAMLLGGCNNLQTSTPNYQKDASYQIYLDKKRLQDQCIDYANQKAKELTQAFIQEVSKSKVRISDSDFAKTIDLFSKDLEKEKRECIERYPL